jgi:hypothetical protein
MQSSRTGEPEFLDSSIIGIVGIMIEELRFQNFDFLFVSTIPGVVSFGVPLLLANVLERFFC